MSNGCHAICRLRNWDQVEANPALGCSFFQRAAAVDDDLSAEDSAALGLQSRGASGRRLIGCLVMVHRIVHASHRIALKGESMHKRQAKP